MSDELSMKDLQMKSLTEKIEIMLKGFDKSKRQELDLAEVGSRLRNFQTALDSAYLELKQPGVHMQKAEFAKILRDHKHTLKELKIEYDWRKAAIDKNMLMHGAKPSASSVNMATANEIMSHGLNVQKASTEALENTRRIISDTKEIGIDTIKKLDDHTNQITSMYDNLTAIDTTLARTTKVIQRIARKIASDKSVMHTMYNANNAQYEQCNL